MTTLDDALTAYRRAEAKERRVRTLHYSYRAATRAELDAATAERKAAREVLDRAVEAGGDR